MRSSAAIPFLLASAMFAQSPPANQDIAKENALGALMAKQFRERNGTVEIPEAQAYLERVVSEIAAAQPGDGPCCSVALYAAAEAPGKPTAYPGGHLFVPAKLFFTSETEADFVRSLAHAVAHIRQRDWNTNSAAVNHASIPLTFIGSEQDEASALPMGMRAEFDAREQRADEAAEQSVKAVTTGTGEFERIRDKAPLPTPRPSLLP